jgi:hypothetical protein
MLSGKLLVKAAVQKDWTNGEQDTTSISVRGSGGIRKRFNCYDGEVR